MCFYPKIISSSGSVTLAKSNAKALLTAEPSKMQPAKAGFALSEGQGQPFEKGSLHPA
jgi:hypothetical protein